MDNNKDFNLTLPSDSSSDEDELSLEEESQSEPEFECDHWDDDCKIVVCTTDRPITGYHLMPTCERDPAEESSKRLKLSPELRPNLLDPAFKTNFRKLWNDNKEECRDGTEIITSPFKVCVVSDFLQNHDFLNYARQEFNEMDWNVRCMDLYEFSQSRDLKQISDQPNITAIYDFLKNDVMKWVSELTDLKLTHISASCSFYACTDYLLVHDDQREDRMVAFILYLSGPDKWSERNGGVLQLLNKDSIGHPHQTVRDILPTNNQFVFFPVTNDSYHQVGEVTSLGECRLSINGWFHTDVVPVFETPPYSPYPDGLFSKTQIKAIEFDCDLPAWVNEDYLQCDIIKQIKNYFEENSEISLKKFLREEPFDELSELLNSDSLTWVKIGPPNRCRYEVAETTVLPVVFDRFLQLFQSKQMFSLLARLTGVNLQRKESSVKFEFQKWTPGCYSLLGDYDWREKKELDVIINFGCKCNSSVVGARTLYLNADEPVQEALVTLEPEENNLNLIFRDTARFTKYYSRLSRCRCFYTLVCSYSE